MQVPVSPLSHINEIKAFSLYNFQVLFPDNSQISQNICKIPFCYFKDKQTHQINSYPFIFISYCHHTMDFLFSELLFGLLKRFTEESEHELNRITYSM